jgi:hypothetical protein
MTNEPVYEYVKGQGWVPCVGPVIYYQEGDYIVIDLADLPGGVMRGFAPWHPEYETRDNDGRGFQEAVERARGAIHKSTYHYKDTNHPRKQHVVAILASDYHLLLK